MFKKCKKYVTNKIVNGFKKKLLIYIKWIFFFHIEKKKKNWIWREKYIYPHLFFQIFIYEKKVEKEIRNFFVQSNSFSFLSYQLKTK